MISGGPSPVVGVPQRGAGGRAGGGAQQARPARERAATRAGAGQRASAGARRLLPAVSTEPRYSTGNLRLLETSKILIRLTRITNVCRNSHIVKIFFLYH